MREKQKQGNTANNLIGYETLLSFFKEVQGQTPKGITLKKDRKPSGTYILLQFKLGNKRVAKACNCAFTMDGIANALRKANQVSEALGKFSSETGFLAWYDEHILEKNQVKNDLITFGEAIKLVEDNYWNSYTKKHQPRDRNNPSHQSCWYEVYYCFYKLLPFNNNVNITDIMEAINSKNKGSKRFKDCVSAMKKLCEVIGNNKLRDELGKINITQTKFKDNLQSISLEDFFKLIDDILDIPENDLRSDIDSRESWAFVFSLQVIYGLRVSEVFAIQNIDKPFKTKDDIVIPPIQSPENKDMIAVVGSETVLGTTTKTGYRLAIPLIPPTCPDLIERLGIKSGKLPVFHLNSQNPNSIRAYISQRAYRVLNRWAKNSKFTQTHALRHLANLNGIMAGIPLEKRAMSLGHTPSMNDKVYKKRQTTKTTLDLLTNSTHQTIPISSAITIAKQLGCNDTKSVKLLAAIYGLTEDEIASLLIGN
ncbi:site-specific integrase [Nostoc sp. FACHB-152]|uniref:site-specific integrase n=1 Tax=Nostoc sp. FACHB-152 TaxID=2692837 RepID=UPI001687BEC9|nr:site-specific integrase [Nostoc sp. FACHB-152]MBD2451804.1 site-specific integrase [Nostoc sp. FACHB-152]